VYSITCETAIFYVEVVPVFVYIRMWWVEVDLNTEMAGDDFYESYEQFDRDFKRYCNESKQVFSTTCS